MHHTRHKAAPFNDIPSIFHRQNTAMEAANSDIIENVSADPYKHLDHLGHGAYGYVDKVCAAQPQASGATAVFARKVIRITSGWNRENQLRGAMNEFKILKRLNHYHVVKVFEIYQYKNRLNIMMQQVADCDLAEYLQAPDGLSWKNQVERQRAMIQWHGCLIRAIDYLHEMRIKHKDLKPANILIMNGQVLIADFGISKDLIDSETTASLSANGDIGTRMYCAPEVLKENGRRGRASDIFSLGCIFLETSTVIILTSEALKVWSDYREGSGSGSRLYSNCSSQILQWIRYLWCFADMILPAADTFKELAVRIPYWYYGMASTKIAFFMLDPNPKTRITARQLVALLQPGTREDAFFNIKEKSCHLCRDLPSAQDPNIPLHSVFKGWSDLYYPEEFALKELVAGGDWEQAKRLWLESHMWW
jgi:serine/threonine protein kinase